MYTIRLQPSVLGGLLAALAIVAAPTSAPAGEPAETSIYGITLGQPFTAMPECSYQQGNYAGAHRYYTDMFQQPAPCFQHRNLSLIGTAPTGKVKLYITYPVGKFPEMYDGMTVSLIDGVVQGLHLSTHGIDTQGHDYALLARKFGKPLVKRTVPVQNRMGAAFEVIEASWQRPNGVSVSFRGATDKLDDGELIVTTPQEVAREQARLDQQQGGVPKL